MERASVRAARIMSLLKGIAGTVEIAELSDAQRDRVVELESAHEATSTLPIRNMGIRLLSRRTTCCALLKDARFRPPRVPTVYLVEDSGSPGPGAETGNVVMVEGVRYRIVGEEVVPGRPADKEEIIPLDTSFVIFPERRSRTGVPCFFMLPPIGFPELEAEAGALQIKDILSISPSLATDMWLRATFGFPPSNALATLLVGWNTMEGG